MTYIEIKNKPNLTLENLLRRRKQNLKDFINEAGIQSYAGLVNYCRRLGVTEPSDIVYKKIAKKQVTSQQDGIVILEPIDEQEDNVNLDVDGSKKKKKRKKKTSNQS